MLCALPLPFPYTLEQPAHKQFVQKTPEHTHTQTAPAADKKKQNRIKNPNARFTIFAISSMKLHHFRIKSLMAFVRVSAFASI